MAAASLSDVLLANAFLSLTVDNKILCSITKHEMPPKAEIVLGHINGKKFKKTLEWYQYDYSEFEPYIVTDRQTSSKLHCKLTGQTLNKIPEEVRKHVKGKKYLRLLAENEELQKKQAPQERDTNPDIWVPPEDLLADDEDDDITDKKEVKSKSKKGTEDASKEIEEDTFSDLLGSDHEDEFDNEDDDDDEDFDEIDGDEDATTPAVEVKKTRKEKVSKKIKDVKKTSSNSKVTKKIDEKVKKTVLPEKSLKRKLNVIEESSAAIEPLKKSKLETTEKKVPKVDKVTVKKASSKVLKK